MPSSIDETPDSIARTWALLFTPTNLFPIMHTSSILSFEDDTIMSGVALFWNDGDYPLAAVIFIASILVLMLTVALVRFKSLSVITVVTGRAGVRVGRRADYARVHAIRYTPHLG